MKRVIYPLIGVILVVILTYFFVLNAFQPRVTPIRADAIESIVLVTGADQRAINSSAEQIRAFVDAFNQARNYSNDVGTTPPARVDVTFKDGTRMTVWGYNQGFATQKPYNGLQQNIRGQALAEWFRQTLAGQT